MKWNSICLQPLLVPKGWGVIVTIIQRLTYAAIESFGLNSALSLVSGKILCMPFVDDLI